MAQLNISYITETAAGEKRRFAMMARDAAAKEVHGLEPADIRPDSVSVMAMAVDTSASISGADIEVQVLVSGNDWPLNASGQPEDVGAAKIHFDKMAARIHRALTGEGKRRSVYVWVTPFTASGWAE